MRGARLLVGEKVLGGRQIVNKRGRIRYLLASSNTGQGYSSFLPALINELNKVYILKGAPGSGRSTFIRQVGLALATKGYETDFFVSPFNASSLEGVIFPQLGLGVVNGDLECKIEARYPGIAGEVINLGEHWDREQLVEHQQEIRDLVNEIQKHVELSRGLLKEASRVKEGLKSFWVTGLNLERVEALVTRLVTEILDRIPTERHYFGSTLSPQGFVSYIDQLSGSCACRYVLQGPPGSGKSTVLLALGERALARGCQVEFYHDGLNPDSLNMIIMTSLGVAVVDASGLTLTARPGDIIIDTRECIESEPEDFFEHEINEAQRRLDALVEEASAVLSKAEFCRKRLQKIYSRAMDFSEIERIQAQIIEEIQ